jgi:hypothetical protein
MKARSVLLLSLQRRFDGVFNFARRFHDPAEVLSIPPWDAMKHSTQLVSYAEYRRTFWKTGKCDGGCRDDCVGACVCDGSPRIVS